ncbi:MAG: sulfurtransferase [Gammaproteobacteria bacterium]|nr:sulfurtransferase [Gammaproteobacteria bacterium]
MNSSLITPAELLRRLDDPLCIAVDCRYELLDPGAGDAMYRAGHIPGAVYLDLLRDLSGPDAPARGRHPRPEASVLAKTLGLAGIGSEHHVVAYDNNNGPAARLWWLLRYLGHDAVSVLDGGWPSWVAAEGPVTTNLERRNAAQLQPRIRADRLVVIEQIDSAMPLVDAREEARYRGLVEPFDPRPGRIPNARHLYWRSNLEGDGRLLDPAVLAQQWRGALGRDPDESTVHYCGSGVTACVNALAQVVAGFGVPRVYLGSYSEWSRSDRPVAIG